MKKRIVSLTAALAMVLSMTNAFSLTASAAEEFKGSGGTGAAESPYIIETLADLEVNCTPKNRQIKYVLSTKP